MTAASVCQAAQKQMQDLVFYLVILLDSFRLFSFAGSSVPDAEGGLFLRSPMYLWDVTSLS
jgi:hypothetical protein